MKKKNSLFQRLTCFSVKKKKSKIQSKHTVFHFLHLMWEKLYGNYYIAWNSKICNDLFTISFLEEQKVSIQTGCDRDGL